MPFGSEGLQEGIGLALSGGGFRATLFHLGALWRLNELGFLPNLDRVSSVSGGSITAGLLAKNWSKLQFRENVATNFVSLIADPLRDFCKRDIDVPAMTKGALLPWRTVSDEIQKQYERHLFGSATLQDLPDRPRFVINATNFQTGVAFRFSKPYAGDYRIGLMKNPTSRLSLAVAASSAFPPVLSPVDMESDLSQFEQTEGADLFGQAEYYRTLRLTDGGAYDNLGLETVWNRYRMVLVSDAGAPFGTSSDVDVTWHKQVLRAFDIATNQARGLRKRALISDFKNAQRMGCYWGIDTDITDYGLPLTLCKDSPLTQSLAHVRTRLDAFSQEDQGHLINWGYALSDAAMRRYGAPTMEHPKASWPDAAWPL